MRQTKAILAVAILGIALTGYSQAQSASPTPNPNAGTYRDTALSGPQRIQLADAALTGTDPIAVAQAAYFMLSARPVINLLTAYPSFADAMIADPTLSGTITSPGTISQLFLNAVLFKTAAIPALSDKVAYLQPFLSSTFLAPAFVVSAQPAYASLVYQQAQLQFQAGNYSGAIATLAPVLGWNGNQAVAMTAQAKIMLRSSDVLSWVKLVYESEPFQQTQAGIDAVSSAFRSLDTNLVRANQFIAFEKSGTGTDPLAGAPLPQVTFVGVSPAVQALNAGVGGNNISALTIAVNAFATAPSGPQLNTATAFVAQWLRNIDDNLVRANAFVTAQTNGQPFTIAELSGTASTTGTGNQ